MSELNPSRDVFCPSLSASPSWTRDLCGRYVAPGIVTAFEKTWPSSCGLQVEGRVPLEGSAQKAKAATSEARRWIRNLVSSARKRRLARLPVARKARREESWGKPRSAVRQWRARRGRHLQPRSGRLNGRSRTCARGVPAARLVAFAHRFPRRHPPDAHPEPFESSSETAPRAHVVSPRRFSKRAAPTALLETSEPRRARWVRSIVKETPIYGAFVNLGGMTGPSTHHRPGAACKPSDRKSPTSGSGQVQIIRIKPGRAPHLAGHESLEAEPLGGIGG